MNSVSLWIFDLLLATTLVALAFGALHGRQLRQSIILFMGFGLVAALAWARLKAPDVALAEAAIGAGLAGALLLRALRDQPTPAATDASLARPAWQSSVVTLLVTGLAILAGWAFVEANQMVGRIDLAGQVQSQLQHSGVSNPVTAVLLNFRAYDTLLELAVLLAALLGIVALGPQRPQPASAAPLVTGVVSLLAPLMVIVAGYLLWVGAHAPGGAFQAGAMLAAAGVIIHLAGLSRPALPGPVTLRLLLVSGLGAFVAVALFTLFNSGTLLQYPAGWAGALILVIEIFATLSIAATLLLGYLGGATPGLLDDPKSDPKSGPKPGLKAGLKAGKEPVDA